MSENVCHYDSSYMQSFIFLCHANWQTSLHVFMLAFINSVHSTAQMYLKDIFGRIPIRILRLHKSGQSLICVTRGQAQGHHHY